MSAEVIPLGAQLRQRREQLGLSQTEAARELEVARTAYRLWEMEAARPAPDRWRVIAKWLGISVTALLLAGEFLDEQEAQDAERAARGAGLADALWDDESDATRGDYFSQERAVIADQTSAGRISASQAEQLRSILDRIQGSGADAREGWHPGRFSKRFPTRDDAPALARRALAATAVGIPDDVLEHAEIVLSELVTNSVRHSGSDWVEVDITLDRNALRIEVIDSGQQAIRPRAAGAEGAEGGWGLMVVAELATKWGVERRPTGKIIWVEFDAAPVVA
jgi:serine/threonine-protein kinase RsbW